MMNNSPAVCSSLQLEAVNENTSSDRLFELSSDSFELRRQVANNPSTPPEVLRKLAESNDVTTRKNVAANPNTPTEVLLNLGAKFPEQLLDNPIFSLLLLENPNLIKQISRTTLLSLLKCETVPLSFLEWALKRCQQDQDLFLALVVNPQTPVEKFIEKVEKLAESDNSQLLEIALAISAEFPKKVLEKLVGNKNFLVAQAAQLHMNWAGEMNSGWDEAAKEALALTPVAQTDEIYRKQVTDIGSIPPIVWLERYVLAQNPKTSLDMLSTLANDGNRIVRAAAKANLQRRQSKL